jgi:hypothetical protein
MTDHLPAVSSGFSFADMNRLAESIARSQLFGIRTPDQALALMAISQAEGRHPALAARDYDIIQGRPAKKAEAMQRDFMAAGGKIEWHKLSDNEADATFSHPAGGTVRIDWNMDRATKAGLGGKDMWKKYPRQMLKARVVSEGVRTVFPTATSGMYVPEEVDDFREPIDVTPKPEAVSAQVDEWRASRETPYNEPPLDLLTAGEQKATEGTEALKAWWTGLEPSERGILGAKGRSSGERMERWKEIALLVDRQQASATPPPEPPAVEDANPPALPQAEPSREDAFGLPLNDDEAFCESILRAVRMCTSLKAVDQVKIGWDKGHFQHERVNRLPEALWNRTLAMIGEHETALQRSAA